MPHLADEAQTRRKGGGEVNTMEKTIPGIYFIIESVEKVADRLVTLGMCGDVSLRIGDTFNYVYQYSDPKTSPEYDVVYRELMFLKPISLTVQKIKTHDVLLQEMGQVMAGWIELTGTIEVVLEHNNILGALEPPRVKEMSR